VLSSAQNKAVAKEINKKLLAGNVHLTERITFLTATKYAAGLTQKVVLQFDSP
jgi:hypothetical protein